MLINTKYGNPFKNRLLLATPDEKGGSSGKKSKKSSEETDEDEGDGEADDTEEDEDSEEDESSESGEGDDDEDEDNDTEKDKKKSKSKSNQSDVSDETKRAIQKARKEERAKCYDRITALEAETASLKTANKKLTRTVDKQQAQILAFGNSSTDGGKKVDVPKLLDEAYEKFESTREASESEEIQTLRKKVDRLTKETSKAKAKELREKLIRSNGGDDVMVVELVTGETEEEILDSIETAKDAFERIARRSGLKTKKKKVVDEDEDEESESDEDEDETDDEDEDDAETQSRHSNRKAKEGRRTAPPELRTSGSSRGSSSRGKGQLREGTVKAMSPQQYKEQRDKLLQSVTKTYGGSGARPFGNNSGLANRASRR